MAKIDIPNLPSNSNKSREEQRKVEEKKEITPVVTSHVTRQKQSFGRKLAVTFLSSTVDDVWKYIIYEYLIPKGKDIFLDVINEGLAMLFNGDPRSKRSSGSTGGYNPYGSVSRVKYTSYHDEPDRNRRQRGVQTRESYNFEDIILESRGDAEKTLDRMFDILEQYGVVTVGDLYQLLGLTTKETDFDWGWEDLGRASTKRVSAGYLLELPKTKYIQ